MTITLDVAKREEKLSAKQLRNSGVVPAVVYGAKQEALAITVDAKTFDKVLKEAGESTVLELNGPDGKIDVLIKDIDFDPVKQHVIHADFYAVEKGKEISANVSLEFIGEAPVEKTGLGTVTKVHQEVEVTCKPADLPNHIDVSLEGLASLEDKILVKDLKVGKGVAISLEEDEPIVVVSEMKEEEEEPVEAVDMDAIEVEEKGKGEEGEEASEEKSE